MFLSNQNLYIKLQRIEDVCKMHTMFARYTPCLQDAHHV